MRVAKAREIECETMRGTPALYEDEIGTTLPDQFPPFVGNLGAPARLREIRQEQVK